MANVTQFPKWDEKALKSLGLKLNQEPVARDAMNALFNNLTNLNAVKEVAKESGRITEVSLHKPGDIVTLTDGRIYQVDDDGKWNRIS